MAIRIRSAYVKQRLAEIAADPSQISEFAARAPLSRRLDKPVAIPTNLYFIETGCRERFIKIGVSSNVTTRMIKMQMDCPYKLTLLKEVVNGAVMEKSLHERFADDRVTGEWFRRSSALMEVIDSL